MRRGGKHQVQIWITAKIGAQPYKGGKAMDRGIDGYLHFRDADKKPQFAIVSVKYINSAMVRDPQGTMEREKAASALFDTFTPAILPPPRQGCL